MLSSTPAAAYAAYQPIRSVHPPESPFAGTLAKGPEGRTVLLVDRDEVADWPGWGAEGEAHLLTPLDVVRRHDGHDVALPALAERLDRFLARRGDAASPPSPGEAVTLAVSIVRGLSASTRRAPDEAGEWWLGEDGKPTLVEGAGEVAARRASAEVLTTLAGSLARTRLGALLGSLADAFDERGFVREAIEWEERLFDLATPEPLITQVLGPLRARVVTATPAEAMAPARGEASRRSWWERLISHLDSDLADTASDALTGLRRRIRSGATGRRRPLLWAAGIAVVVVVLGLLWPTGSEEPVATSDRVPLAETTPPIDVSAPSVPAEPPAPAPSDDPAVTATALLDARTTCTDAGCLATVLEDPALPLPPGVVDSASDDRRVSLVDDLGGLAVVRVEAVEGAMPLQLVTIVETTKGWRIRNVYDVTDAPS